MSRLSAILVIPLLLAANPIEARTSEAATPGVVSAADPRAAGAGAEILRKGGSATDAAIATMLALTVVEPQSSGIGGGGFLVHAGADGSVTTYDGRETAPAAATGDWFMQDGVALPFGKARLSGLSVGVPGNLRLAALAHSRSGKLPWADLFDPAIRLARKGFRITPRLNDFLQRNSEVAGHDADGRSLFFDKQGKPLSAGTLVKNRALAKTFELIAAGGADRFYEGSLAQDIATDTAAETPRPVGMTAQDIAGYLAKERPAVCGEYRKWRICGMGPPSSGATTVLAILKQLERFDLATLGSQSPISWHLFAESQRLAYADRELYLGDSDFVGVPVAGLIDTEYLSARSKAISPVTTMADVAPGTPPGVDSEAGDGNEPEENGTSHFVAIDRFGDAVSYTSTIEAPFGSGIVTGGFYLNNELTDFSFSPDKDGRPVANRVEGGKRPRSSMSPTLAWNPEGELTLAVGAAGGSTIPVQVSRVLIGVIDWGLPVDKALALPLLYSPGETVIVEEGSALEAMIPSLAELGHAKIKALSLPLKTNAAQRTQDGWLGAADPRSEGAALSE